MAEDYTYLPNLVFQVCPPSNGSNRAPRSGVICDKVVRGPMPLLRSAVPRLPHKGAARVVPIDGWLSVVDANEGVLLRGRLWLRFSIAWALLDIHRAWRVQERDGREVGLGIVGGHAD